MPEDIVLRLTPEEFYLLQTALALDTLPGFASDLLSGLDDSQREQALNTADHSLRARGLVGWNDSGQRIIKPVLTEMLLDYARPRYTLLVDTYVASRRAAPFLYVFGELAIYEQCQPEPDVLQLRVLTGRGELERRLHPELRQKPYAEQYASEHIIQRTLNEGIKVARENEALAQRIFAHALSQVLATELAIAYHEPGVVQYIARWERTPTKEQPAPVAALTILQGQECSYLFWVEDPQKGEQAQVAVRPATGERLSVCLAHVLPPEERSPEIQVRASYP